MPTETDRLLTPDDLATRYQVSRKTVLDWARGELIGSVKVGRFRRFRQAHVDAFEARGDKPARADTLKGSAVVRRMASQRAPCRRRRG